MRMTLSYINAQRIRFKLFAEIGLSYFRVIVSSTALTVPPYYKISIANPFITNNPSDYFDNS